MALYATPDVNDINPTALVRFDQVMTLDQAVALHRQLGRILGRNASEAPARPAAVTPIRRSYRKPTTGVSFAVRYLVDGWAPTSLARRKYETLDGARAAVPALEKRYGRLIVADILERHVGPWTLYEGQPATCYEYKVEVVADGWVRPKVIIGGHRKATALIDRNEGTPGVRVTVHEREIRSPWQLVESLRAVVR